MNSHLSAGQEAERGLTWNGAGLCMAVNSGSLGKCKVTNRRPVKIQEVYVKSRCPGPALEPKRSVMMKGEGWLRVLSRYGRLVSEVLYLLPVHISRKAFHGIFPLWIFLYHIFLLRWDSCFLCFLRFLKVYSIWLVLLNLSFGSIEPWILVNISHALLMTVLNCPVFKKEASNGFIENVEMTGWKNSGKCWNHSLEWLWFVNWTKVNT